MMNIKLLKKYGAETVVYEKDDFIFEKDMWPEYFYYIVSGEVKLNIYDEDDTREFIFSFYSQDQNFGEGTIFLETTYICNAIAVEQTEILKLHKDSFLTLIKENHDFSLLINYNLSKKLYFQGVMAPKISAQDAELRVLTLLNYLKTNWQHPLIQQDLYIVDLTRQEIADMTGLRVETVIRSIKKLREDNKLRIIKGRIVL
ncbi:Crp/Fnr family transcriptional regulator [Myroides odoratimimus]|uniref:Crp/Fnr family transcriptional regulator n=1 Tax=Myroides odoratimimus TaxID=76832 RepID=UPI002577E87E|nr:Crp/Fnr family transcriptional regulator [Myroides odoratimimus]MDO5857883.1 Crp/Fnr family transcriptional regulator [Myroides odoratimimus]MEC4075770.1 Crp/Fnr family transcriptional regulator [Myroides odoratimimus]